MPAGLWPLIAASPRADQGEAQDEGEAQRTPPAPGVSLELSAEVEEAYGPQLQANVQRLSLEGGSPLRAAVAIGTAGSIVAGATAGAVLAGPAAPLGAVVGGLVGSLVAVETGFVATLSGRRRTPRVYDDGLAPSLKGEGSAAAVAACKLELVQQRTGLCPEEASYYLDDAQGDAELAIASYEAEERALQEELMANPSLRARLDH